MIVFLEPWNYFIDKIDCYLYVQLELGHMMRRFVSNKSHHIWGRFVKFGGGSITVPVHLGLVYQWLFPSLADAQVKWLLWPTSDSSKSFLEFWFGLLWIRTAAWLPLLGLFRLSFVFNFLVDVFLGLWRLISAVVRIADGSANSDEERWGHAITANTQSTYIKEWKTGFPFWLTLLQ